jgi:hypothetical protein
VREPTADERHEQHDDGDAAHGRRGESPTTAYDMGSCHDALGQTGQLPHPFCFVPQLVGEPGLQR